MAFIPLGPSKISAKLSLGHQSYEYIGVKPTLDALASDWTASKSNTSCEDAQITSARNVRVKNIKVLLNNKDYFITTFGYLDAVIPKSENFELIPLTDVAALYEKSVGEIYNNSDSWTLKIELVQLQ